MGNSSWKVTPALPNLPKQLPYSFLYLCSYIKKKSSKAYILPLLILKEKENLAESKAQIAHFKSTWEQEKVFCDYINSSDKCM